METDHSFKEQYFSPGELLRDKQLYSHVFVAEPGAIVEPDKPIRPADIDLDFAREVAGRISLLCVPEKEEDKNLCLADSSEVIPVFRETCTPTDILNYVLGILTSFEKIKMMKDPVETDFIQIPYPQDCLVFWRAVEAGKNSGIKLCPKK